MHRRAQGCTFVWTETLYTRDAKTATLQERREKGTEGGRGRERERESEKDRIEPRVHTEESHRDRGSEVKL